MKKLYICEKHHHVLLPWAMIREEKENILLLTFDHHTDTHDAFLHYLYYNNEEKLDNLIKKINYKDHESIISTIKLLRNDEHIDTALKCNFINKAFVISYDGGLDKPTSYEFEEIHKNLETKVQLLMGLISLPDIQTYPESDIYIIGTSDYIDNSNCISDEFISTMIKKIKVMSNIDIASNDYILDIDLDYFHTYDSINRNDLDQFKYILSKAHAITIVTEPSFAVDGVDTEILLSKIINLAEEANINNLEVIDLRKKFESI